MKFEEKIKNGVYPSKEEFENLLLQNITRAEICKKLKISKSTYDKIKNYYGLSRKKHVCNLDTYTHRGDAIKATYAKKYGELGSQQRNLFYKERYIKTQQTCLQKYGILNSSDVDSVKQKRKETCLAKYGVDNPMKSENIQQKAQITDLTKYGVPFHISSPEVVSKTQQTLLNKFGSISFQGTAVVTQKREATNLARYGYATIFESPEFRKKAYETMKNNGQQAVLSSKQQVYINRLYGGQLNYLFEYYHADIYLEDSNLIVEYSGRGHDLSVRLGKETLESFLGREKARRNYFSNRKIPILELISKTDKLPPDSILLQILQEAKNKFQNGVLYYSVDLDTFIM